MKSHDVNILDDRNKILNMKPQQLVNPEQRGLRNKFLSWLMRDVDVDVLNVKHLEVYGKNTLTTPKIVITDSTSDPANNGEITRNGTAVKVKTADSVINIGRSLATDEQSATSSRFNVSSFSTTGQSLSSSYVTKKSQVVTPDSVPNKVALSGVAVGDSDGISITAQIAESATPVVAGVSSSGSDSVAVALGGVLDDVSAMAHTYDLQVKYTGGGSVDLIGVGMYAVVIKLV